MFKKNGMIVFLIGAVVLLNLCVYTYLEYKMSTPVTMTMKQDSMPSEDSEEDFFITLVHSKDWPEGPREHGIQYDAVFHNNTGKDLTNWSVRIKLPKGARISDSWNIEYELDGPVLTVRSMEHNSIVEAENIQSFGFIIMCPVIEDITDITYTFDIVYKLTDYKLFRFNIVLTFILATVIIGYFIAEYRIAPVKRENEEDKSIIVQTMQTFSNFIDTKDPNTKGHSMRVAYYSKELAKKLKLPDRDVELIYYIALLHDIGKIYIPDEILNKPGRLTGDERAIIETHAAKGAEILKDFTAIDGIADGARYHHERYDGKGYPQGLKGENIPFLARIIGVADSYDAMSSDRCYRPRLSKEAIVNELKVNSGKQFDPEVVACMLELMESYEFYTGMLDD